MSKVCLTLKSYFILHCIVMIFPLFYVSFDFYSCLVFLNVLLLMWKSFRLHSNSTKFVPQKGGGRWRFSFSLDLTDEWMVDSSNLSLPSEDIQEPACKLIVYWKSEKLKKYLTMICLVIYTESQWEICVYIQPQHVCLYVCYLQESSNSRGDRRPP